MQTRRGWIGSLGAGISATAIAMSPVVIPSVLRAEPPVYDGTQNNQAKTPAMPDWKTVAATAKQHFQSLPNYQPGDVLSQGQIKPLLAKFAKAGWKLSDQDAFLGQICADDDFVVRQLRSKSGQKFMRNMRGSAEQYDYFRRLAATKGGDRAVADIMKLNNGNDVLAALATSKAGKDISRRLADGPKTQDYNTPTGYLYTETQILARLKESHTRDARAKR
jgi:hypothetical protein